MTYKPTLQEILEEEKNFINHGGSITKTYDKSGKFLREQRISGVERYFKKLQKQQDNNSKTNLTTLPTKN